MNFVSTFYAMHSTVSILCFFQESDWWFQNVHQRDFLSWKPCPLFSFCLLQVLIKILQCCFPVSIKSKVICSTNCIRNSKFSIYFNSLSTLSRWLLLRSWSVKKKLLWHRKSYPRPRPCFRTVACTNVLLTELPESNSAIF